MKFHGTLDKARFENLSADPSGAQLGQVYYNTTVGEFRVYTASGWSSRSVDFSTSTGHDHDGADSKKVLGTNIDSTGASANTFLKADGSNGATWASAALNLAVTTKIAAYTPTSTDDVVLANATSGAFTLTLPAAASNTGKIFRILKTDTSTNAVSIDPAGTETINGVSANLLLTYAHASVTIVSDGSNWRTPNTRSKVMAKARVSASGGVPTSATVANFSTVDYDPFGAITTGAGWKFTAPVSDYYRVYTQFVFVTSAAVSSYARLKKGGTTTIDTATVGAPTGSARLSVILSTTVFLNAGEFFQITHESNVVGAASYDSGSDICFITIEQASG